MPWRKPAYALATTLGAIALLSPVTPAFAQSTNDVFHLGELEYEVSCMACHGADGRGDGPAAPVMDPEPTDLTTIAARLDGVFPAARLALIIDGREWIASHGPRTMPIWGERYSAASEAAGGADAGLPGAITRIEALVAYIESIQVTSEQP